MKRRFVNLVTRHWSASILTTTRCVESLYSVRRIDPYHAFFYGSAGAALQAADDAARKKEPFPATETLQLPSPSMNFHSNQLDMFALFGRGLMVYANTIGEAGLYDADRHIQYGALPGLNPKGFRPICISIPHPDAKGEDSLYVLDSRPRKGSRHCFEVLENTVPPDMRTSLTSSTWRWRLLPPPPFLGEPPDPLNFEQLNQHPSSVSVTSLAAVVDGDTNGGFTIYISCGRGTGVGTYSFKAASRGFLGRNRGPEEWSHVGEWKLPFTEKAQYVPEFNLWFGFLASSPHHLCAVDLSPAAMDREPGRPPTAQHVWQDLDPPDGEEWFARQLELVHLGDGKFLIAKTFKVLLGAKPGEYFTVFTGVEMVMAGDQSIQMVKHKCSRFDFTDTIEWVL